MFKPAIAANLPAIPATISMLRVIRPRIEGYRP
jgi:hypothetical protein